jgi:hypothetical protein
MLAPNYALELSICDYLTTQNAVSGSLLSGSNITYYTGIGIIDKMQAPAVLVDASDMVEITPYSRNYTFTVEVSVRELKAEISQSMIGVNAMAVFNEFTNTDTAKVNFSNPGFNINVINVRDARMRPTITKDAFINDITVTIEGAIVP